MSICSIEKIQVQEKTMLHDMVSRILLQKHTALAAIGSQACIRTLWFRAYRLGKIHHFFGAPVSETEYALGKQINVLGKCQHTCFIQRAIGKTQQ